MAAVAEKENWLYRCCVEKRDLAYVTHCQPPRHDNHNPNDVDLQVSGRAEHGIARPRGRKAVARFGPPPHGGISVYDSVHHLTCFPAGESWRLDTTSVSCTPGLNIDTLAYWTAEQFRAKKDIVNPVPDTGDFFAAQGCYTKLLYRCRESVWDASFWEVVRDADFDASGHAIICPRADVPEDIAETRYKLVPKSHSEYLLKNLDMWEFVGILFRVKGAAKLYEWSYGPSGSRAKAVVFAAEALMDVMDRMPALVDELEPIALALLQADVKTLEDLAKALDSDSRQSLLSVSSLYDDYLCVSWYEESHTAELLELEQALL